MTLLIQSLTVTLIVPAITLIATLSTVLRDIETPYTTLYGRPMTAPTNML